MTSVTGGASDIIPVFRGVCVNHFFVFCVDFFLRILFVVFLLAIVLSVLLRFANSDYIMDMIVW
jgi:hypothetical protein